MSFFGVWAYTTLYSYHLLSHNWQNQKYRNGSSSNASKQDSSRRKHIWHFPKGHSSYTYISLRDGHLCATDSPSCVESSFPMRVALGSILGIEIDTNMSVHACFALGPYVDCIRTLRRRSRAQNVGRAFHVSADGPRVRRTRTMPESAIRKLRAEPPEAAPSAVLRSLSARPLIMLRFKLF